MGWWGYAKRQEFKLFGAPLGALLGSYSWGHLKPPMLELSWGPLATLFGLLATGGLALSKRRLRQREPLPSWGPLGAILGPILEPSLAPHWGPSRGKPPKGGDFLGGPKGSSKTSSRTYEGHNHNTFYVLAVRLQCPLWEPSWALPGALLGTSWSPLRAT